MRTIFVLLAAQALLVSLAAAKSDRRVLRMNKRKLCADCSDDETNSDEEGNDCMCPQKIYIQPNDVDQYFNTVKNSFTPVGLVGSDPLGTLQYVVTKTINGVTKECNANPLLEDAYYGYNAKNDASNSRRRLLAEDAQDEGLQIVPGIGALGATTEVEDGEAGARRVLLGSNNNYCSDAMIVKNLKFETVTNCPEFCTDNYCEGKIFWSTFINIDKQQCVRAGSDIQDDQCAVKSEAQFQSRTSFKNNDNINFPSNNKYKGQISAQSVGPQDLVSGSTIKSDLRNLGIRDAKNGIGKVAITWSITTFVPSSTFIADVNAGKYNYFNDNVNAPTNTSSLMYWTKTKKLQLKAGSVYCAAVLNSWRDPSPYRSQSCSPQDPYACRDVSDYLVGDCDSTVPDPNNPGKFLDMCKKQRTAIWIYIPYGDGYVVPVFDTEALADTDYRVSGAKAITPFRDPCVEPTIIPDTANPSAKGGNPINIVASTFILPDANKQCTGTDNECDPIPPCTCPSPPPPPTHTPPPPPPAVCPTCPACVRRRLSADDLLDSEGDSTWSIKADVLVDLPCTATPYLQSLQLAQTFTEVAYKALEVPVVADSLTCGPDNQVQIGVKALVGLEGAWNMAEALKGKVLSAFTSAVKGTVSSAVSVVDAEPALVDAKLSFVASSGFEDNSTSAKPARKRFLF